MSSHKDKDNGSPLSMFNSSFPEFHYTDRQWNAVRQVVEDRRLAEHADAVRISVSPGGGIPVESLKTVLEVALYGYQFNVKFRSKYPTNTRHVIRQELGSTRSTVGRLFRNIRDPIVRAYGPDSKILEDTLEDYQKRLNAVYSALERATELPGDTPPKDGAITEGWQKRHRNLLSDPADKLVGELCNIYARAFGKRPGAAENSPAADFIRAAAYPVVDLGGVRRTIEKYNDGRLAT